MDKLYPKLIMVNKSPLNVNKNTDLLINFIVIIMKLAIDLPKKTNLQYNE